MKNFNFGCWSMESVRKLIWIEITEKMTQHVVIVIHPLLNITAN